MQEEAAPITSNRHVREGRWPVLLATHHGALRSYFRTPNGHVPPTRLEEWALGGGGTLDGPCVTYPLILGVWILGV